MKNVPELDKGFMPMYAFRREYLKNAGKPVSIAIERNGGLRSVYDTFITGENEESDRFYIERTVKFLLWMKGGVKVTVCGDGKIAAYIRGLYAKDGKRAFDAEFMERVYGRPFEVNSLPLEDKPEENERPAPMGGRLEGCRIGFDAGGSDRKVSAVVDGKAVYSEEVVWNPKEESDPDYHYSEIVGALKTAAGKMPRVDAIGVSSAGIYIDNRAMAASLFIKVSPEDFERKVRDIYIRAAKEIGDVPLTVVNDGDVTALAGAMELGETCVLGVAMGTSQAAGFVDENGNITGWLNELAFAPIDASENAATDEWSGDVGCGVKYFSQDGVIKLAGAAGISFEGNATPGAKLKTVQGLLAGGDGRAKAVFRSLGCYLGHTLPYYQCFYNFRHVLLLGRVMSGEGGDIILKTAQKVLAEEYPEHRFNILLPDEKNRRIGQSVAAASL